MRDLAAIVARLTLRDAQSFRAGLEDVGFDRTYVDTETAYVIAQATRSRETLGHALLTGLLESA